MVPVQRKAVLWIRIGFKAKPGPVFFSLYADPDPGSQTNADPYPGQTLYDTKSWIFIFYMKNYTCRSRKWVKKSTVPTKVEKAFLKGRKPGLLVNFGKFPSSLLLDGCAFRIRIRKSIRIHIYNSGWNHLLSDLKVSDLNFMPVFLQNTLKLTVYYGTLNSREKL